MTKLFYYEIFHNRSKEFRKLPLFLLLIYIVNSSNSFQISDSLHSKHSASNSLESLNALVVPSYLQKFLFVFQSEQLRQDEGDDGDEEGIGRNFTDTLFQNVENDECKGHVLEWLLRFAPSDQDDELGYTRWATEKDQWAAQSKLKLFKKNFMGHRETFNYE